MQVEKVLINFNGGDGRDCDDTANLQLHEGSHGEEETGAEDKRKEATEVMLQLLAMLASNIVRRGRR